jgi:uncharacterized caspase-like protein
LKNLGFKIARLTNVGKQQMDEAIQRHADQVRRAGPNTISFFYYSGHGVVNPETNVNYLIPVDVEGVGDESVWYRSLQQSWLIELFSQRAGNATHFIIFDACRNELTLAGSPGKTLSADKGFAPVNDVNGILIAYSTAQKKTAADSGMFARILSEELVKDGVEAFGVFREVHLRVREIMKQEPWLSSSYIPRIYLGQPPAPSTQKQQQEQRGHDEALVPQKPDGSGPLCDSEFVSTTMEGNPCIKPIRANLCLPFGIESDSSQAWGTKRF